MANDNKIYLDLSNAGDSSEDEDDEVISADLWLNDCLSAICQTKQDSEFLESLKTKFRKVNRGDGKSQVYAKLKKNRDADNLILRNIANKTQSKIGFDKVISPPAASAPGQPDEQDLHEGTVAVADNLAEGLYDVLSCFCFVSFVACRI